MAAGNIIGEAFVAVGLDDSEIGGQARKVEAEVHDILADGLGKGAADAAKQMDSAFKGAGKNLETTFAGATERTRARIIKTFGGDPFAELKRKAAEAQAQLDKIGAERGKPITFPVEVENAEVAIGQLQEMGFEATKIDGRTVSVTTTVEGFDAAIAKADALGIAAEGAGTKAQGAVTGVSSMGRATGGLKAEQAVQGLSELSGAMGGAGNQALQSAQGVLGLGQAMSAAGIGGAGLTAALGPIGVAIAGIGLAIGVATLLMDAFGGGAEKMSEESKAATEALSDQVRELAKVGTAVSAIPAGSGLGSFISDAMLWGEALLGTGDSVNTVKQSLGSLGLVVADLSDVYIAARANNEAYFSSLGQANGMTKETADAAAASVFAYDNLSTVLNATAIALHRELTPAEVEQITSMENLADASEKVDMSKLAQDQLNLAAAIGPATAAIVAQARDMPLLADGTEDFVGQYEKLRALLAAGAGLDVAKEIAASGHAAETSAQQAEAAAKPWLDLIDTQEQVAREFKNGTGPITDYGIAQAEASVAADKAREVQGATQDLVEAGINIWGKSAEQILVMAAALDADKEAAEALQKPYDDLNDTIAESARQFEGGTGPITDYGVKLAEAAVAGDKQQEVEKATQSLVSAGISVWGMSAEAILAAALAYEANQTAAKDLAEATGKLTEKLAELAGSYDFAEEAQQSFLDVSQSMTSEAFDVHQAYADTTDAMGEFASAMDEIVPEMKKQGKAFGQTGGHITTYTRAGRDALDATEDLAGVLQTELAQVLDSTGGNFDKVRERAAQMREEVTTQLKAAGVDDTEIENYLELLRISEPTLEVDIAIAKVKQAQELVDDLLPTVQDEINKSPALKLAWGLAVTQGDLAGQMAVIAAAFAKGDPNNPIIASVAAILPPAEKEKFYAALRALGVPIPATVEPVPGEPLTEEEKEKMVGPDLTMAVQAEPMPGPPLTVPDFGMPQDGLLAPIKPDPKILESWPIDLFGLPSAGLTVPITPYPVALPAGTDDVATASAFGISTSVAIPALVTPTNDTAALFRMKEELDKAAMPTTTGRDATVRAVGDFGTVGPDLDELANPGGSPRIANITARVDTSAATRALDTWILDQSKKVITVKVETTAVGTVPGSAGAPPWPGGADNDPSTPYPRAAPPRINQTINAGFGASAFEVERAVDKANRKLARLAGVRR